MDSKSQTEKPQREAITSISEFDLVWNISSVPEFTEGKIVEVDGMVAYQIEQRKYVNNQPTDQTEKVPYLNVQVGKITKPTKLNGKTSKALKAQWGDNPQNWKNKAIMSKHDIAGSIPYLVWSPKGKLS